MRQSFFHRFLSSIILYIMLSALGLLLLPLHAQAYTDVIDTPRNLPARAAASGHITIMVLDMSGSMSQNDPQGLRCSAANAYIDLSGRGSFIGVIGLDNNTGGRGGPHNFQLAQNWIDPVDMSTLHARQALQQAIAQKSHNCQPDNSTPTYDSLNQALTMLNSATNGGQIPGSVILLTDGVPDPDTDSQINAIQSDLVPQFKQHNWPIDTIALGADTSFHKFLSNIADATAGNFYDDGNGVVSGVSPLNIAPFFVDIFAKRIGRTVQHDIPPTQLNGGTIATNFTVTPYANSLDIVVVKDQGGTTVVLKDANGQVLRSGAGVFVSAADPHYVIYSIDSPKEGTWELDVTGTGQFLMDSLKKSDVGLTIAQITQANLRGSTASSVLPLNEPITVSAYLTSNGQPITDDRFTVTGTITYTGGLGQYSHPFALSDKTTPGTYVGNVTVPDTAPPGSYTIHLEASGASAAAVIVGADRSVRLERFPVPFFLDQKTNLPTVNAVNSTVIEWDPGLRIIYGFPLGFVQKLSGWPLQNLPALPDANLAGQIELQGQPYIGDATVTATAVQAGTKSSIPVDVVNDGQGRFHVLFPALTAGTYTVNFQTGGTFQDSHGDFGATSRTVQLSIQPATTGQELHAWGVTALYLFCLIVLYYLLRFLITPRPFGEWVRNYEGDIAGRYGFNRARRGPPQWFFHRNLLSSRQANMPRGLQFRFRHGGGIEVRPDGPAGDDWRRSDGSTLRLGFQEVRELVYRPGSDERDPTAEPSTYSVFPRQDRKNIGDDAEDDYNDRRARRRSGREFDDDDDGRPVRGGSRTPAQEDYDDDYGDRSRRRRKQSGRGRSSYADYDDE